MTNYFIHIPRTGGTSLHASLPASVYVHLGHDLRDRAYRHPSTVCTVDDFTFACVRDPFDRLASAFYYLLQGGNYPADNGDAYLAGLRGRTLEQFVLRGLRAEAEWQIHFLPQSFFLRDVPNVKRNRFGDWNGTFADICQQIGVVPKLVVRAQNQSGSEFFDVRFDERTRAVVHEVYEEDFKLLKSLG